MNKVSLVFSLFLLPNAIIASHQSPCTQLQEYVTGLWIAVDVACARTLWDDNEAMRLAAEYNDRSRVEYCLKNKIGTPQDSLRVAKLLKNEDVVEIIKGHLKEEEIVTSLVTGYRSRKNSSPRTVTGELSPVLSQISARKKND